MRTTRTYWIGRLELQKIVAEYLVKQGVKASYTGVNFLTDAAGSTVATYQELWEDTGA